MLKMGKKNKEYYVVLEGRQLTRPMTYSSWAKAHVRTSGYCGYPKGFKKYDEAVRYIQKEEPTWCDNDQDIVSETECTTPKRDAPAWYAVAYGREPGIYRYHNAKGGSRHQTDQVLDACYKHFSTEAQAIQFMEDWKQEYYMLVMTELRDQLDRGLRPNLKGELIGPPLLDLKQNKPDTDTIPVNNATEEVTRELSTLQLGSASIKLDESS